MCMWMAVIFHSNNPRSDRSDIFAFAREAAKNVSQSGVVGVA